MDNILEFSENKMFHYKNDYFYVAEKKDNNTSFYIDYLKNYYNNNKNTCDFLKQLPQKEIKTVVKKIKNTLTILKGDEKLLKMYLQKLIIMQIDNIEISKNSRTEIIKNIYEKDYKQSIKNSIQDNLELVCKYMLNGGEIVYNGEQNYETFLSNYNNKDSAEKKFIAGINHRVCFNLSGKKLTETTAKSILRTLKNVKKSGIVIKSVAISKGKEAVNINDITNSFDKKFEYNYSKEELEVFKKFKMECKYILGNKKIGFCEYVTMDKTPFSLQDVEKFNIFLDNIIQKAQECNMSPLEKIMFYYQNVCSLYYKECNQIIQSRDLMSIFTSGNIVCVGYVSLLKAIIDRENDKRLKSGGLIVSIKNNHAPINHVINLISIKDTKYHIDGNYFCDPTFDSVVYKRKLYSLTEFMLPFEDMANRLVSNFDILNAVPAMQLIFGCNKKYKFGMEKNVDLYIQKYKNLNQPISNHTIEKCYREVLKKQNVDPIIIESQTNEVLDISYLKSKAYYKETALNGLRNGVADWKIKNNSRGWLQYETQKNDNERINSNINLFNDIANYNFHPVIEYLKQPYIESIYDVIKKVTTKKMLTCATKQKKTLCNTQQDDVIKNNKIFIQTQEKDYTM